MRYINCRFIIITIITL